MDEITPYNLPPAEPPVIDESAIYDTIQNTLAAYRGRVNIGAGDSSMHIEKTQGQWMGAESFADAPFSVDMQGNVIAESITVNGSDLSFQNEFGDGSDGALTTSGNVTLTKDVFYTTLTITAGDTFNPAGFRVFCSTSCTVNGTIARNGNAGGSGGNGNSGGGGGSAGSAGAALASGTIGGAAAGTAGVAGANALVGGAVGTNGNAAAAETSIMTTGGKAGVAGGASGSSQAGGTGGSATAGTQTKTFPRTSSLATFMIDTANSSAQIKSHNASSGSGSGAGGSGGSGTSGGGSGGSGSNGGMIFIAAPTITVSSTGSILATGGAGGAGGDGGNATASPAQGGGGGGGGSGGSGGTIVLMYKGSSYTNSGTVAAAGGSGGAGGAGGAGNGGGVAGSAGSTGNSGSSGTIITLSI